MVILTKKGGAFMNIIFKRTVCILLTVCFCFFALTSCSGGIGREKAKDTFEEFFRAVKNDDFEKAEGYLHPSHPGMLEIIFYAFENTEGIDFQESIVIERYSNFSSAYYDSAVDGSRYSLVAKARVSDVPVTIECVMVDNEEGYGVYSFNVYKIK